ncbi:MAG: methyltransferase domain-containing protein [Chitinophagales bacterium]
MAIYDKYYKTENLFGEASAELIDFFATYETKGKILDLGCGQGRDSIPLARLGFEVLGLDNSKIGIDQMNRISKAENLSLKGMVTDIFSFSDYKNFDFVLLDSMFHFAKKDRKKELLFIQKIISEIKNGCFIVFCIQDTGKKVDILNEIIENNGIVTKLLDKKFTYLFEDKENSHTSKTNYRMIVVEK